MTVQQPTGTYQGLRKDDNAIPSDDELLDGEGSPLWRDIVARFQRAVVWLLSLGPVPRHVALVPDGHRRFSRATSTDLPRAYAIGAQKFFKLSELFFHVGADMLSAFMFSVRNFSRNTFDMTAALNQAQKANVQILEKLDVYKTLGVQCCVCGDLERLPVELRVSMARSEIATSNLGERLKNQMVCAGYNSTYQMSRMALHLAKAVQEGDIRSDDITGEFLDEYVALTECPSADLLFRAGGDQRFSDFEVLQCNYAYFHVEALKWPDVGFLSWMRAMIHFQLLWPAIQAVKEKHSKMVSRVGCRSDPERVIRQHTFLRHVHATRLLNMEQLSNLGKDVVCH